MADIYIAATAAGSGDGSDWANVGDESDLRGWSPTAGDTAWIKGGSTITLTAGLNIANDGTAVSLIHMIGVKSGTTATPPTASDYAEAVADQPLIACGANSFLLDNYWELRNLKFTTTYDFGVRCDTNGRFINCTSTNSSGTADRAAFMSQGGSYHTTINCNGESTNGYGFLSGSTVFCYKCYFHDSNIGIDADGSVLISDCILDTCTTGIILAGIFWKIAKCSIYNCTSGIAATSGSLSGNLWDTTISGCTDGFKIDLSDVINEDNKFDYNNWYDNTRDMSWDDGTSEDNTAKGPNALAVDPNFNNAAGGDFSLTSSSALLGASHPIDNGV